MRACARPASFVADVRAWTRAKLLQLERKGLIGLATLVPCALALEAGLRSWTPSALRMRSTRILLPTNVTIESRWASRARRRSSPSAEAPPGASS